MNNNQKDKINHKFETTQRVVVSHVLWVYPIALNEFHAAQD
jgi:hypothetical protein